MIHRRSMNIKEMKIPLLPRLGDVGARVTVARGFAGADIKIGLFLLEQRLLGKRGNIIAFCFPAVRGSAL